MAENTRKQLSEGRVLVEFDGQQANFELSPWLAECYQYLEDPEALVNHLRSAGVLKGFLHRGLRSEPGLVGFRAVARPNKTKADPRPTLDTAGNRRRAKDFQPTVLPFEDGGKTDRTEKAVDNFQVQLMKLMAKGYEAQAIAQMSKEQLLAALRS